MKIVNSANRLEKILNDARRCYCLPKEDIIFLLALTDKRQIESVFQAARERRSEYFGNKVFLYGFVYTSTYCRNDCKFCFFRRSNRASQRYRKTTDEIIRASSRLAESGVHLIDLTMGEDPEIFFHGRNGFDELVSLVRAVVAATGLPVMISPGVIPDYALENLKNAGTTWYACYQETHNPALFNKLRTGQNYQERLGKKYFAHKLGMLIEEGLLCGIGESDNDIAESIEIMRSLDADQIRVMNFVPQRGTPMEARIPPDPVRELMITAIMRLAFPDRLIPASLDVGGLTGLHSRLDAGANVVTSLIPPGQGLAGVAQNSLDIEDARRTEGSVQPVLRSCGLQAASSDEYLTWIAERAKTVKQKYEKEAIAC